MKIWTVDAFADKIFSGNPAAVIPVGQFPPDELCQKIAAEMNLSETAFVQSKSDGTRHIRWFTPTVEVKLCGHATLASAHVLFEEKMVQGNNLEFQSLSGPLRVSKNGEKLTLDFPLQKTGSELDMAPFEKIVGFQIVAAVKAYDDLIVELADEKMVRELKVTPGAWPEFDCRGVIFTAKGQDRYDFVSRFFGVNCGVGEDPVTGSAHCKLAHYWMEKLGKKTFTAYQASARGGVLEIEVVADRVLLTGRAITVMKGEFIV